MGLPDAELLQLMEEWRPFEARYELGKFLGRGGSAYVFECRDRASKEECACKAFDRAAMTSKAELDALEREILVLKIMRGQHRGIVQLREVLEGSKMTWIVMENCKGGDLFKLISSRGGLPEHSAKLLFKQLASAVRFCHSHGIVHRDIKLENILLSRPAGFLYDLQPATASAMSPATASAMSPATSSATSSTSSTCTSPVEDVFPAVAKLADFGLSVVLRPGDTTTGRVGTEFYTPPEILLDKPYGRRVDVWSLGVVLCAMLTGRLPFTGMSKDDHKGLAKKILKGKVNFAGPEWKGVSLPAKNLVSKMLMLDPKFRIKTCEILMDPWLCEAGEGIKLEPRFRFPSPMSSSFALKPLVKTCASRSAESLKAFLQEADNECTVDDKVKAVDARIFPRLEEADGLQEIDVVDDQKRGGDGSGGLHPDIGGMSQEASLAHGGKNHHHRFRVLAMGRKKGACKVGDGEPDLPAGAKEQGNIHVGKNLFGWAH